MGFPCRARRLGVGQSGAGNQGDRNMSILTKRFPPVPAYHLRDSPLHIAFWCPWCRNPHFHGRGDGDGKGFRASHCHAEGSPLVHRQYYLIPAGTVSSARTMPRLSAEQFIELSNRLSTS
jgi:hypothetical protein